MDLYLNGKILVKASKVKQPKFSYHRGRTWDTCKFIIDGIIYKANVDTTWGRKIYFQYKESWYAVNMLSEAMVQPSYTIEIDRDTVFTLIRPESLTQH